MPLSHQQRQAALDRAGRLCERCGGTGTRGRWRAALEVHHKVQVIRGGGDEPENLEVLCGPCHDAIPDGGGAPKRRTTEDKQLNLWMTVTLWRRLRVLAAKQDTSVTELINRWLTERADSEEKAGPNA